MDFILDNLGNILVISILILIIFLIIRKMRKDKKNNPCSCGCSGCVYKNSCQGKK